ncbi:unnamed protein product, partial [Mesorhabditis spiculigera]
MSNDHGIDSKPKGRGYSARGRRKALETTQDLTAGSGLMSNDANHDDGGSNTGYGESMDLNIRVKDRSTEEPPKKGRTGGLFKEQQSGGIKGLFNKEAAAGAAAELKETIKRPLTGLFRRPGSRAGRNKDEDNANDEKAPSPKPERFTAQTGNGSVPSNRPAYAPYNPELEAMARAPQIPKDVLQRVFEIDSLGGRYPNLTKVDDIDLTLLLRYTLPEEEVTDEDTPWNWDYLFASITTEIKSDMDKDDTEGFYFPDDGLMMR